MVGFLLASLVATGAASAGSQQTSLGLAVGWHDGPRQVAIGAGPQLSHRAQLGHGPWQLAGGVERLWLVVPSVGLRVEAAWSRVPGRWSPSVGGELATSFGRVVLVTAENPRPPWLPPTALRLRIRPLVWMIGEHSLISALELAPGVGLDTPLRTVAFGLTPLALSHRW